MMNGSTIAVVIPVLNEEASIGKVISAIPEWVDDIVVVDNGSSDRTAEVARWGGARVIAEARRGYGSACLAGIAALSEPDVVVFLDGDYSDHPNEMGLLVNPILAGECDMVIGSRVLGKREHGALTIQARFGNWLSCLLIRLFWRVKYTDLGPFRAIRRSTLERLDMQDRNYGWTVELQVKAAQKGLRVREVPVSYRRRTGKSKISGTVRGTVCAGTKILFTIFRAALFPRRRRERGSVRERLVIFTRYPEPGKTKTRLIPALGAEGAADFQRRMTFRTLAWAKWLEEQRGVSIEVHFEGGSKRRMREWFGTTWEFRSQGGGDLGERMARTFQDACRLDVEATVIVGTDCPGITTDIGAKAFNSLRENDLVLGPAKDGGYYLIGLRQPMPELFQGIEWGTSEVLKRTVDIAKQLGLSVCLLEALEDVDRPEDLPVGERHSEASDRVVEGPEISIIIPTLNEADSITATLAEAKRGQNVEIIVVDGGSTDQTVDLAQSQQVTVLTSLPGRAVQMNSGSVAAKGDLLLFLHADTHLPGAYDEHIRRILGHPSVAAGAFEFRIGARSDAIRFIEWATNIRSRKFQMPYGDQTLFIRADLFREAGGFPEMPIMDDFEFVRILRKHGCIVTAPVPAITSARRWLRLGVFRTTFTNRLIVLAYRLGVSPETLVRWYGRDQVLK